MENLDKRSNSLNIVFNILFWGALWGIVEATLGTLLHLPAIDKAGMYACSSTIIIPIAYYLMANCYKRTNSFYAVFLMGILASMIKLCVGFVIGFIPSVINPAIYIVVESLLTGVAFLVFRPKNVLSLRTFGAVVFANTAYQFSYLLIKMAMGGTNIFASERAWKLGAEPYLFTINAVAIIYLFASGALFFGAFKLAEKLNFKFSFDFNKLIHSPITASVVTVLAVGLTIGLTFVH